MEDFEGPFSGDLPETLSQLLFEPLLGVLCCDVDPVNPDETDTIDQVTQLQQPSFRAPPLQNQLRVGRR